MRNLTFWVLATVLLVLVGCTTDQILSPGAATMSSEVSLVKRKVTANSEMQQVTALIGPSGGLLRVPGGHQIVFPAGALLEPTTITLTIPKTENLEVILEPHGLVFPAGYEPELTISYKDGYDYMESSLRVVYVMEGAIAEELGTRVDVALKQAVALLKHFSTYALGTD
jgi:hypothetical protein